MKKLNALGGVSALALAGYAGFALAQTSVSADVGTPGSANTLIIEQGYDVVSPVQPVMNGDSNINNQMQPLPGDPGVDVAPLPEGNPQPAPSVPVNEDLIINETITTTAPMQ